MTSFVRCYSSRRRSLPMGPTDQPAAAAPSVTYRWTHALVYIPSANRWIRFHVRQPTYGKEADCSNVTCRARNQRDLFSCHLSVPRGFPEKCHCSVPAVHAIDPRGFWSRRLLVRCAYHTSGSYRGVAEGRRQSSDCPPPSIVITEKISFRAS